MAPGFAGHFLSRAFWCDLEMHWGAQFSKFSTRERRQILRGMGFAF
jgi:hypothetical protein